MAFNFNSNNTKEDYIKELFRRLFRIPENNVTPAPLDTRLSDTAGLDRSGVCGGTILVTPSQTAFANPSWIQCKGADGTVTGVDEYGNTVTAFPMVVGEVSVSRWSKVTAVSAGVVIYRHYSV